MKKNTILIAAASLAVMAASVDLISPKAVRAAVATLIRDQDNPARHPFTSFCFSSGTSHLLSCSTPAIPAGEEVVVENVSLLGTGDPMNKALSVILTATTSGQPAAYFFDPVFDSGARPFVTTFARIQPLRIYADPGTTLDFSASTAGSNPGGFAIDFTVTGYSASLP